MTMCGNEVERYDIVAEQVPFVRVAAWCERKLEEAEKLEEQLAEMNKK